MVTKQAIDDVRSSYSKLIEIESRENVIKDLRKNKVIGKNFNEGLFPNGLDDSGYENYLKNLENKIKGKYSRVKNVNKEQLKSALNEVSKALINARTEIASQVAKTNIQNIEDVLSNNKPKYNLYKNILGITGDKSQAISLAGFDTSSFKDQIDFYKDQISAYLKKTNSKLSVTDLLGFNSTQSKQNNIPEGIQGIVTETNSLIDEQKQSIVSEALNVISQYGTIEKKIEIVKNKANELKEKVKSSNIFSRRIEIIS